MQSVEDIMLDNYGSAGMIQDEWTEEYNEATGEVIVYKNGKEIGRYPADEGRSRGSR